MRRLTNDYMANTLTISRNLIQKNISALRLKGYLQVGAKLNKTYARPALSYVLSELGINSFSKQYALFSILMMDYQNH
jgi:predicted ArsR family transcriptional regulator